MRRVTAALVVASLMGVLGFLTADTLAWYVVMAIAPLAGMLVAMLTVD